MKLLVLIGTDYHLNQLPHFLAHYAGIGVDQFVCGLHGYGMEQARALLAPYPFVVVADYGTEHYDAVANRHWVTHFNDFRRQACQPDEWCLFADVDEFHEYPLDFFAQLEPQINAIRGKWVERLATPDGQLLPCLPTGNIGQQFPFATREIFCGISEKIMAVRADLELIDGYHWVKGGTAKPVYPSTYLNVHHFRWDDRAASKYQNVKWTRHYQFANGRVPALRGVFAVDPPFPTATISGEQRHPAPHITAAAPNDVPSPSVIWVVGDGGSETTWIDEPTRSWHYTMKITAYPLYHHAPPIQPPADQRARPDIPSILSANLTLDSASRQGWQLLCPCAFTATWNGGPNAADIEIQLAKDATLVGADFVQSQLGGGMLTFYSGYQFKTEETQLLWIRGPINAPKDGLAPLESLVDASLLPCTVAVHWQFTRPNRTIYFEAGEPFGVLLPYAKHAQAPVTLDVVELGEDVDAYEQAFAQLLDSAALQNVFQRLGTTPAAAPSLLGVVFSRDRAMQLDATLRSFYLHCQDADAIPLYVLYKTTSPRHAAQYAQLAQAYAATANLHFVEETDFRQDLLRLLTRHEGKGGADQLLFLVDDNLFVRNFRLAEICETLANHAEAIGFSLRLGANITHRSTVNQAQVVPTLMPLRGSLRSFDWTAAQGYFNYALEVSSSVYRMGEMTRLLAQLPFANPNTLEVYMAERRSEFSTYHPRLLCYEQAVTFCNPINKVQTVYANLAGTAPEDAPDQLADLFDQGYRIRVKGYAGFEPNACHQEVALLFEHRYDATPAKPRQYVQLGHEDRQVTRQAIRIGYLIMAHNTPNHFARLVDALYDDHAQLYVHIDKKSNILPFQAQIPSERVHFLPDRILVYWSEYSTAQAILNLIAAALSHDSSLDYLCLLSGSDYPLRSASYIRHYLTRRQGTEFMNLVPMPNKKMGKALERLTHVHFPQARAEKLTKRLGVRQLPVFERDYRQGLGELQPYGGSTWWTLSRPACEQILRFTAENRRAMKFFKHTLFAEEGLFQTIIGNSPFRRQVARNLTFDDWTRPVRPYPAIIDEQHIQRFLATPALLADDPFGKGELLFARKFPDASERLVAQLQPRLELRTRCSDE